MKVILKNGTELTPILVTGTQIHVQGAKRDSLTFVFPASEGIDTIDTVFSETDCESIKIYDDNGAENIYKYYTIRTKLEKALVEIVPATPETEAVMEERISVTMAQRTYIENQLALLSALNVLLTGEE